MIALNEIGRLREILVVGAHCDDVEIGCGGAILRLAEVRPDLRVRWVVWSSTPEREAEGRVAAGRFLEGFADRTMEFHTFRDGYFPSQLGPIKDGFERLKEQVSPDLILTHTGGDAHQDHRVVRDLTWNTFRDHLILEYEVPKYDPDVGNPNVFVALDEPTARRKVEILMDSFRSQRAKRWFTEETFFSWMHLRAVQTGCPARYAEGFYASKALLEI